MATLTEYKVERTLTQSFQELLINMGQKLDFLLSFSSFSWPSTATHEDMCYKHINLSNRVILDLLPGMIGLAM